MRSLSLLALTAVLAASSLGQSQSDWLANLPRAREVGAMTMWRIKRAKNRY